MTTYPRNRSASAGKLLLNTPKIPRPRNLACNSPTLLSNIETRTLIFRGFQGVSPDTNRGIACEIWGGLSGTCGIDGIDRIYGRMQTQPLPGPRGPEPQRCPKRRPPRLKPPKTVIAAEMVCTLGRLPVRAILTSTHRLPTPPRRPRARTRIGCAQADRSLRYPHRHDLSA